MKTNLLYGDSFNHMHMHQEYNSCSESDPVLPPGPPALEYENAKRESYK